MKNSRIHRHKTLKRGFDILFALLGLLTMGPILITVLPMHFMKMGPPILLWQERIGLGGKRIVVCKVRTMWRDAGREHVERIEANVKKTGNPTTADSNDTRIGGLGRFLRKHGLDEVPQLFQVLSGSMSIVGPRPMLPEESRFLSSEQQKRFDVKPGVTGLAQVSLEKGDFWQSIEYDLTYVRNWTAFLDLAIILRTPASIFRGRF